MAFVLKARDTYKCLVEFELPISGGKTQKCSFTGEFLLPKQSRLEEVAKLSVEGTINDAQFATELLVGWGEDVKDENGEPIEFSAGALAELLEVPKAAAGIVSAFYNSLTGKAGKRGN